MIEPLCRRLRQTGCSGAFVLLDATVNTRVEGAEHSRAGLYVQKSGADTPTVPPAAVPGQCGGGQGPQRDAPPQVAHGVPDRPVPGLRPLDGPRRCPAVPVLHADGTVRAARHLRERAAVLLPWGQDGTMYGLCGFEISESYFKQNFAQPTGFDRLSCLLAPAGTALPPMPPSAAAPPAATTMPPEHAGAAQHGRRADPVDRPRQRLCGHLPAVPPE